MKPCPTCGREIEQTASLCESCEVWAATLVLPPAGDPPEQSDHAETDLVPDVVEAAAQPEPTAVVTPTAAPASRRGLVVGAAAASIVVMLAVGMLAARTPASSVSAPVATAPAAAAPAAPATAAAPAAAVDASPVEASVPVTAVQRWSTDKQDTWLGGRRHGAAFELPAENVVKTWFGPARPSLVVRCVAKHVDVFVFTGMSLKIEPRATGKTVTLALDGEPMRTERWPDSDDHDALFAPDAAAFTSRLLTAHTLRFGYSPHNSSDVVAQFNVAGLDALVKGAAKQCGQ